jgi:GMP synthase (glutamine-hydrolysing)
VSKQQDWKHLYALFITELLFNHNGTETQSIHNVESRCVLCAFVVKNMQICNAKTINMHIHFIQHVPFEYPSSIIDWVITNNHIYSFTKIYESATYPSVDSFDALIIMGGPMGVYEEDLHDWIVPQTAFIKTAIDANKKVLGVCLGSQFIAKALGSKVYPHTLKEIGWWPVEKVNDQAFIKTLPSTFTTFHWHGDTFDLPTGATHLFKSEGCLQQGFIYNDHVIALQFHMEVKEDLLNDMTDHEKGQLAADTYVQTEQQIHAQLELQVPLQQQFMFSLLQNFLG